MNTVPSRESAEYISPKEAAEALDVSVQVVRKHIRLGHLPAYRFGGRVIIKRSDLADFIQPYLPGTDGVA